MCLTEFDEKAFAESMKAEGYAKGHAEGHAEGLEEGLEKGLEKGEVIGEVKGRYKSVKILMSTSGYTEDGAMDALAFTAEEKVGYRKWFKSQTVS